MECSTCKYRESARLSNYGELTSLGGEIQVLDCYTEYYDPDLDECLCYNYEVKQCQRSKAV